MIIAVPNMIYWFHHLFFSDNIRGPAGIFALCLFQINLRYMPNDEVAFMPNVLGGIENVVREARSKIVTKYNLTAS